MFTLYSLGTPGCSHGKAPEFNAVAKGRRPRPEIRIRVGPNFHSGGQPREFCCS